MLLWLISNYDKVTNRRKTVRWLPDKITGSRNDSIDWTRWIIKPEINRARGYTQLYDFLCSLAESWFFTKLSIVLRKNSDADWDFSRCRLGIWEFSLDWESTVLGIWEFSFDWESTVYRYFIKKEENRCGCTAVLNFRIKYLAYFAFFDTFFLTFILIYI